jgi:hypothetical protein
LQEFRSCRTWEDHGSELLNPGLSRLNFIFAAAVFSAVYLVRFNQVEISFGGFLILATVLFSIFCYTLELERIGRALVEPKDRNGGGAG